MKKITIILSVMLALCAFVFAGGSSEEATELEIASGTPIKGGTMVFATDQMLNSMFNPYEAGNAVDWAWLCLETLGYQNPGSTEWHLLLADSFEVDAETATATIKVKQGVTFHNGDTLDAYDVAFSIQAWNDFGRGATIGSPVSVTVVDDYTVQVKYDAFSLNITDWLMGCFIYSKETFEEHGVDWMLTNMVGTGPYMMTEFLPDVSITYERYDNYWNAYDYGPDKVEYLYISEPTTMLAAFLSGEVDFFKTTSAEVVEQLKEYGFEPQQMLGGTEFVHYAIPMTTIEDDPLSNQAVRQAIYMYGIDWDAYAYALLGDMGYHTDSIGAAGCPYYDESLEVSTFDRQKAIDLIAQAGYPDGFETTIYTDANNIASATILQSELGQLNIDADVEVLDSTILQEYMNGAQKAGGIITFNLGFGTAQMDRFNKFYSYKGAMAGCTTWSQEEKDLYDKASAALTQEEQNQYVYDYVKQYVQIDSDFWPVANAMTMIVYQNDVSVADDYFCGTRGMDPLAFSFVN